MEKILIIESNNYSDISNMLVRAAIEVLQVEGVEHDHIVVEGVFEVPTAASIAMDTLEYQGVIALGCIIKDARGGYNYTYAESLRGINEIGVNYSLPVGMGIMAMDNEEQALEQASAYGKRAAEACVSLLNIKRRFDALIQDDNEFAYEN